MIILIPDLSENITPERLYELVASCMKSVWILPIFRRKGQVEKCEILRIKDRDSNQVEYQGLVYVSDEMTGNSLIKQLNGCQLAGICLNCRVYHIRSPRKERRVNLSDSNDIAIINRRKTDRRRSNLLIERVISPPVPSVSPI